MLCILSQNSNKIMYKYIENFGEILKISKNLPNSLKISIAQLRHAQLRPNSKIIKNMSNSQKSKITKKFKCSNIILLILLVCRGATSNLNVS